MEIFELNGSKYQHQYHPFELKTLFDEKIEKLDKVIFKEIKVINTMLTRQHQKVSHEAEKELSNRQLRSEIMHQREIQKYKKSIEDLKSKLKIQDQIFGRDNNSRRNSQNKDGLNRRGSIASRGSSHGRLIQGTSQHSGINFLMSSSTRKKENSSPIIRSKTVAPKKHSTNIRHHEESRIQVGLSPELFNLQAQNSAEEPHIMFVQKPEHYHSSILESYLKRNDKQSLKNFIKESDGPNSSIMAYLTEDSIDFKASAVSANLRQPLTSILNEICADFFREVLFLHREQNFQNENKLYQFKKQVEENRKGGQRLEIDLYNQAKAFEQLNQEINQLKIDHVKLGNETIMLGRDYANLENQSSTDEQTFNEFENSKPKKSDVIKNYEAYCEKLKSDVIRAKENLEREIQARRRLEKEKQHADEALIKVRMTYTKDILNYQAQLDQSKLNPDYEYVQSKFLDMSDTYEESIKVAWDFQKKQTLTQFNKILEQSQHYLQEERIKHNKFQRLCEDGNVLVKLSDLNVDQMVTKLMIVEDDPYKIWQSLEENFGVGYFNQTIEAKLGVTTDFKDRLYEEFKAKLKETIVTNEQQMTEFERKAKKEIQKYKEISIEKTIMCNQIIDQNAKQLFEQMKEHEIYFKAQYNEDLKNKHHILMERCQRYMNRCNELDEIVKKSTAVKELKVQNLMFFFEKWKWRGAFKKLIQLQKGETPQKTIEMIRISKEMMKPKKGDLQIMHENHHRTRKNEEKMEVIYLENQQIKINANSYINKFNYSQVIIQQLNAKLLEISSVALNLETEIGYMVIDYKLMKDSSDIKDLYIEQLEKEQYSFSIKLKKMGDNHPVKNFFAKDPEVILDEIRNRIHIIFAKRGQKLLTNIMGEGMRSKFVQTEMMGIRNPIEISYNRDGELYMIAPGDKAIQAIPEIKNMGVITEANEGTQIDIETETNENMSDIDRIYTDSLDFFKNWKDINEQVLNIKKLEFDQKIKQFHYKQAFDYVVPIVRKYLVKLQKNEQISQKLEQFNIKKISSKEQTPIVSPNPIKHQGINHWQGLKNKLSGSSGSNLKRASTIKSGDSTFQKAYVQKRMSTESANNPSSDYELGNSKIVESRNESATISKQIRSRIPILDKQNSAEAYNTQSGDKSSKNLKKFISLRSQEINEKLKNALENSNIFNSKRKSAMFSGSNNDMKQEVLKPARKTLTYEKLDTLETASDEILSTIIHKQSCRKYQKHQGKYANDLSDEEEKIQIGPPKYFDDEQSKCSCPLNQMGEQQQTSFELIYTQEQSQVATPIQIQNCQRCQQLELELELNQYSMKHQVAQEINSNPIFKQLMKQKKSKVDPQIGVLSSHLVILDKVLTKKHQEIFRKFKDQDCQTDFDSNRTFIFQPNEIKSNPKSQDRMRSLKREFSSKKLLEKKKKQKISLFYNNRISLATSNPKNFNTENSFVDVIDQGKLKRKLQQMTIEQKRSTIQPDNRHTQLRNSINKIIELNDQTDGLSRTSQFVKYAKKANKIVSNQNQPNIEPSCFSVIIKNQNYGELQANNDIIEANEQNVKKQRPVTAGGVRGQSASQILKRNAMLSRQISAEQDLKPSIHDTILTTQLSSGWNGTLQASQASSVAIKFQKKARKISSKSRQTSNALSGKQINPQSQKSLLSKYGGSKNSGITVYVNQPSLLKSDAFNSDLRLLKGGIFQSKTIDNFQPQLLSQHSNFYTNMGAVNQKDKLIN